MKGTFKSTLYHIAFITMQMDELNEMWNNKRINDHSTNIFEIILEIIPNNPNSAIQVLMKTNNAEWREFKSWLASIYRPRK